MARIKKMVNAGIKKVINDYAQKHNVTLKEAAEHMLIEFKKEGLQTSTEHVENYLFNLSLEKLS